MKKQQKYAIRSKRSKLLNNLDFTKLLINEEFWLKRCPYNDIVLSTKIRLLRNVFGVPFSYRQDNNNDSIISISKQFMKESSYSNLDLIEINSLDDNNKRFLRERNIISQNAEKKDNCSVIFSNEKDFSILINDKDHFRIQIFKPGFQLPDAYRLADEVDNELNKFAIYAFSEEIGFVTSNPLDGAFGISVMLHLPVLSFTKRLNEIMEIIKLSRLKLEGLKGEGVKTFGNMFVLAGDNSRGASEDGIIQEFETIIHKIITMESEARESYLTEHGIKLEDRICRSYGILKYAKRIGYVESMDYLSDVRLGIVLSIIKNIDLQKINYLIANIQWSHIQKLANRIFSDTSEGDIFRASYLRDQLAWGTI